jgi:two-component system NtrC family sensor kinase
MLRKAVKIRPASRGAVAEIALHASEMKAPREVLLVTDAAASLSLGAGYRIQRTDGDTAWRWFGANGHSAKFSGVILDFNHQQTGLDFCRRLRSTPRTADLPVIVLVTDPDQAMAALAAGADEFCFSATEGELSARLAHCLLRREQAAQMRWREALAAAKERLHHLLHTHLDLAPVLKEIAAEIASAVRAASCGVVVFDESADEPPRSAIFAGADPNAAIKTEQLRLCPAAGSAAYRPVAPVFSGLAADPERPIAELVWPLVCEGRPLGALVCAVRGEFDELTTAWLDEVAVTLGAALGSAELYACAQLSERQLVAQVSERQYEIEMQRRLTEKVIDSLPVSLYVVDRDLRIVAWNRNREVGGQGIDRQRVIGRSVVEVFSKMPRPMLEAEFGRVFSSGESLRFEQESNVDGVVRHWLISKIPMRLNGEDSRVTHVITLGEEITEQKKMNEAIIHAEKLTGIGRLASGVVHEINNPLATIAACAEALRGRLEEATELAEETQTDFYEYLKIIHDESFRCKTITNSLLEFSRMRQAEKTELDLNYLVAQTLQLIKHHPKFKRLQIIKEATEDLAPVFANEAQMKQVFIALISNAFDAMDEGGCLRIRTLWHYNKGQRLVGAEFVDDGCGIAPEHIAKIFEPFFTTKPFGQGTGLGLAVCYGIVSDHRGKIEVDSQIGRGTAMRVLLPPYIKS